MGCWHIYGHWFGTARQETRCNPQICMRVIMKCVLTGQGSWIQTPAPWHGPSATGRCPHSCLQPFEKLNFEFWTSKSWRIVVGVTNITLYSDSKINTSLRLLTISINPSRLCGSTWAALKAVNIIADLKCSKLTRSALNLGKEILNKYFTLNKQHLTVQEGCKCTSCRILQSLAQEGMFQESTVLTRSKSQCSPVPSFQKSKSLTLWVKSNI